MEVEDEECEVFREGNVVGVVTVVDRTKANEHERDGGKDGAISNLKMHNTSHLVRSDADMVISNANMMVHRSKTEKEMDVVVDLAKWRRKRNKATSIF